MATPKDWIIRINQLIPSPRKHPRVAIFGSVELYHQDSSALCDEIGRGLAREMPHVALLTGANADTQKRVSKAFQDETLTNHQANHTASDSHKPPLIFHLAPVGYSCDFGFGTYVDAGQNMEERRYILANLADVCVSIEGGPGSADEMKKALSAGKTVIPLIRTGGASSGMFDAPSITCPASVQESTWSLLKDGSANTKESAQAVITIVQSVLLMNDEMKREEVRMAIRQTIQKDVTEFSNVTYSKRPVLPDTAEAYITPTLADCAHLVFEGSQHIDVCSRRFGDIYLGPKEAAEPSAYNQLLDSDVSGIVNCSTEVPCYFRGKNMKYCRVTVYDTEFADIFTFLEGATTFINYVLSRGDSVLVHCERGVSRSSTIMIAYLIRFWKMTRDEAYLQVKRRRPVTNPNPGFWDQLQVFEEWHHYNATLDKPAERSVTRLEDDFDKRWARRSNAIFVTCKEIPEVVERDKSFQSLLFIERREIRDHILYVCLDFVWGRGLSNIDLDWLVFVCRSLDQSQRLTDAEDSVSAVLQMLHDENSEFYDVWAGEIYTQQIEKLVQKLQQ